jgi:hypothetical protein
MLMWRTCIRVSLRASSPSSAILWFVMKWSTPGNGLEGLREPGADGREPLHDGRALDVLVDAAEIDGRIGGEDLGEQLEVAVVDGVGIAVEQLGDLHAIGGRPRGAASLGVLVLLVGHVHSFPRSRGFGPSSRTFPLGADPSASGLGAQSGIT